MHTWLIRTSSSLPTWTRLTSHLYSLLLYCFGFIISFSDISFRITRALPKAGLSKNSLPEVLHRSTAGSMSHYSADTQARGQEELLSASDSDLYDYMSYLTCTRADIENIRLARPNSTTILDTDTLISSAGCESNSSQPYLIANLKKFVDGYDNTNIHDQQSATVLSGESIFGLESISNLDRVDGGDPEGKYFYIGYRLRLNIDTSFFVNDRLRIRLESRTIPELEDVTGTPLTNISFDGNSNGIVEVSDVWYRFPLGSNTEITLTALGGSLRDNVPVVNPLFYGSSRGSISVFGSQDPIIRSPSGAGIGVSHYFSKDLNVSVAYIGRRSENSNQGLFGNSYSSILQFTYKPTPMIAAAISATYSLNDGFLRDQFDVSESVRGLSLSGELYYQFSNSFALGVRGGIIEARATDLESSPRKQIASYAVTAGFPGLWGKGNLLGLVFGQPPALIFDSEGDVNQTSPQHFEVFYRYTISDYLSITPGAMYVLAPAEAGGGIGYWIGALRMTFRF